MQPNELNQLIARRRSVYPVQYIQKPVDRSIIEQLLINAHWAPSHRGTFPWRFQVYRGEARIPLAEHLQSRYDVVTSPKTHNQERKRTMYDKVMQSDTVIAIIMERDEEERVPEWEEVAAMGAAVQNMWLTCTAHGLGAHWSSSRTITEDEDFLDLQFKERCLGLFYIGYYDADEHPLGKRPELSDQILWKE